jgi:catechol 2,3-dioxygenase-like lactoylglutathione lyase family enzyme
MAADRDYSNERLGATFDVVSRIDGIRARRNADAGPRRHRSRTRTVGSEVRMSILSDNTVFPILLSHDLDASRTFYRDVLGLEVLREDPGDRIVFRCGNGSQVAVTLSTVGTADSQTQLAWRVPDIRAAVAELRERGVRVEDYEAPDPVTDDGVADMGHSWAAWFIDPSRNVLAVVQPKG